MPVGVSGAAVPHAHSPGDQEARRGPPLGLRVAILSCVATRWPRGVSTPCFSAMGAIALDPAQECSVSASWLGTPAMATPRAGLF